MPKIFHCDMEKDKTEWLKLKSEDISSTEISALFGASKYTTEFELYHKKLGKFIDDFQSNERMEIGTKQEPVVAELIMNKFNIKARPLKTYMRHDTCPNMGSSFDYEIFDHPNGPGILEIKNVDYLIHRDEWIDDEAHPAIEMQLQQQLEVADYAWGAIGALVGGNNIIYLERERNREMGKIFCQEITRFWKQVHDRIPPEPNFERDAKFIIDLHRSAGSKIYNADENEELKNLIVQYDYHNENKKTYTKEVEVKKAEILHLIGDNYSKVSMEGYNVSCGTSKDTPSTIITESMIGQEIGGKRGSRKLTITKKKEKQ